jgi:endonuclease/exonuclease/phosphatase family metal-dependent hydrolase
VGETKSAQPAQKTITIASFNIQILGEKKVGKVDVMETVAKIIRRYDLVAIQEVRSTHDDILKKLLGYVNMEGQRYDYIISSRLGRTTSKEQYAFIYNTATIKPIANSNYVVKDTDDVFEREPFVSSFKSGNFDFTLVDIHTKPEDTPSELTHLAVVVNSIYKNSKEKDIIALGDMNADGSYYKENTLNSIFSPWVQLIGNSVDTTVAQSSNTYDRMIASPEADKEYAGGSGVFRWDSEFGMTDMNYIKSVSDHYPVYAVFRTDLEDDD